MEKNLDYVSITYTQNLKKTYKKEKKENLVFLLLPFMVHNEEGSMK